MLNIIVGVIAILLGVGGVTRNWYMFIDMIGVIIPLALLSFGIISLLAGIRGLGEKQDKKEEK